MQYAYVGDPVCHITMQMIGPHCNQADLIKITMLWHHSPLFLSLAHCIFTIHSLQQRSQIRFLALFQYHIYYNIMAKLTKTVLVALLLYVACFTHERKFSIATADYHLWACLPFVKQGYQHLGSWCEKVTKKERSDHISHISPLSSDQPSGTLDPLQGGWPTLGFHRSPMLPTMRGLSRVSRAEKDSISGLLLALSDLSKWL